MEDKEILSLMHGQWMRDTATIGFLNQVQQQQQAALEQAMNLAESGKATTEQLLVPLIKAKTLTDLLNYVKTSNSSITRTK